MPAQDKNKLFLEKKLCEVATVHNMYEFTYPELLRKAKTVDTVWFNERKMPCAFYEVEHTTDIKNSLNKFYELQILEQDFVLLHQRKKKDSLMIL